MANDKKKSLGKGLDVIFGNNEDLQNIIKDIDGADIKASKNILEIGTYTGYAALCLAEGLQADGQLITIDVDAEKEWICNKYFMYIKLNVCYNNYFSTGALGILQLANRNIKDIKRRLGKITFNQDKLKNQIC